MQNRKNLPKNFKQGRKTGGGTPGTGTMEKYFGVCYYPELYPKEKQEAFIREDIENMRRARFNVVRMAEFCWCLMEPREGVYDFDWLEEIVDRLGQNGIYTVL